MTDRPRIRFSFGPLGSGDPDSVTIIGAEGTAIVGVKRWSGEVYVRTGRVPAQRVVMDGRTVGRADR